MTKRHYHLATLVGFYTSDNDVQTTRHMNTIFETSDGCIDQSKLNQVLQAAVGQLVQTAVINVDQVEDITLLGISSLGHMAPEDFYDQPAVQDDAAEEGV